MVNQLAAAHERDLITQKSRVHLVANYPDIAPSEQDEEADRPTVKLQLVEGDKQKTDLIIDDPHQPDTPLFF